ncbi:MAG: hypothetical protein ACREBU_04285 [Nitrososphaera sp.]
MHGTPAAGRTVERWLSELESANTSGDMKRYDERCRLIRKRYRYEGSSFVRSRHYQMLWSNIETMKSAVYSKPPHPVVSRRYSDADPAGRLAAQILERAINFTFDSSDFDGVFKQVRDDFLLYGRGVARIYYVPEFETKNDLNEDISDAKALSGATSLAGGIAGYGIRIPSGTQENSGAPRYGLAGDIGDDRFDLRGRDDPPDDSGGADRERDQGDQSGEPPALKFENVKIRFVQRSDFRHQPARTWEEVQWAAFRAFMTRKELIDRFGRDTGKAIALDSSPDPDSEDPSSKSDAAKATVWEIWDKAKNRVLWIAKGHPNILEEGEPYLILDGFYPCPRPAYGTLTNDSLVPVPDYVFYQDQCEEIDQLTARIGALSDSLKLVGFYPGGPQGEGSPEIEKALSPGFENKMIAVQSWDAFRQGGGGGAPVVFLPIEQVSTILQECISLRKQLVEDIYQIIGISDIMRGATDPQETEGAQHLKAQFGGTRVRDRQQEIARFCRDAGRLCGQVIAAYCSPETIEKMTNIDLPSVQELALSQLNPSALPPPGGPSQEEVFGLLKDSLARRFKIDIENESTIAGDEVQERQDRTSFIQSVTQYMTAWGPMVMQKPELAPLAGQLLLFGVRAFRVGRELEEIIEELSGKLEAAAQNPQAPPPDPRMQVEALKLQGAQAKAQAEIEKASIVGQTAQMSARQRMQEQEMESATKIAELRLKLAQAEQEHHHKTIESGLDHAAALDKMAFAVQKQAKPPQWPQPKINKGF